MARSRASPLIDRRCEVELVPVEVLDRHVTLAPGLVLRGKDDLHPSRAILLVEKIDGIDAAGDREAVGLPVVLVERERAVTTAKACELCPLHAEDGIVVVLLETEHVAVEAKGVHTILDGN